MATNIKTSSIKDTFDRLVLVQDGNDIGAGTDTMNIEIQTQAGLATATPLYISTDRIGIGTASPQQLLNVEGTNAQICISEAATEFMRIGVGESTGKMVIGWDDGDDLEFGLYAARDTASDATVDPKMCILSSGNVGIGTASPVGRLQVTDDTGSSTTTAAAIDQGIILHTVDLADNDFYPALSWRNGDAQLDTTERDVAAIIVQAAETSDGSNKAGVDMRFYVHANNTDSDGLNAATEKMCILQSGNVGIGTDAPATHLHIKTTGAEHGILKVEATNGSYAPKIYLTNEDTSWQIYNNTDDSLRFWSGSADVLNIANATGYVGIGTADPDTELEVDSSGGAANATAATTIANSAIHISSATGGLTTNTSMFLGVGSAAYTWIQSQATTDGLAKLALNPLGGNVGIGTASPSYNLDIDDTTLTDGQSVGLEVTGTGNSIVNQAKFGVVYESGAVTDAPTAYIMLDASDGNSYYYFTGDDNLFYTTATFGNIGKASQILVGGQSSDERLKDISSDVFPYGLTEINALSPIKYTFKKDKKKKSHIGFGAQTTQSIIPESVTVTKDCIDGYNKVTDSEGVETEVPRSDDANPKMTMEYVQIIPVLVKAIQELSAKVTALENNNKQTGESSNEQEEQSTDSGGNGGDASGESSGQDSSGVEGNSDNSASASDGESASSESSSDDSDESAGSSGSDAPDDSEAGS